MPKSALRASLCPSGATASHSSGPSQRAEYSPPAFQVFAATGSSQSSREATFAPDTVESTRRLIWVWNATSRIANWPATALAAAKRDDQPASGETRRSSVARLGLVEAVTALAFLVDEYRVDDRHRLEL